MGAAISHWHVPSVLLTNNTVNNALLDVLLRPYWDAQYFKNVLWFHRSDFIYVHKKTRALLAPIFAKINKTGTAILEDLSYWLSPKSDQASGKYKQKLIYAQKWSKAFTALICTTLTIIDWISLNISFLNLFQIGQRLQRIWKEIHFYH